VDFGAVHVRVLYNEGCPNLDLTLDRVRRVFEARVGAYVLETVEVTTHEDAVRLRFHGSPTVQVDGVDIDPLADARAVITLGCRLYDGSGAPSEEMLEAAVPVATS
jgi:hypothetical protein